MPIKVSFGDFSVTLLNLTLFFLQISKEMLDFGKGLNQFKVGQAYEDRFTLSWPKQRGGKNEGINFQLHPPTSPKFTITFTPSQGTVKEVSSK
jgi:hypothetical protein